MKLNLDQEKDKCFMHLFSQGVKFPHNLNVNNLIQKDKPSPVEFFYQTNGRNEEGYVTHEK